MSIADNIKRVEDRIAAACARAGRDPAEVCLVGISKTKPAQDIISAIEAGLRHIGENRVEESISKIPRIKEAWAGELSWHMVGHVQSRKAKHVVSHFDMVQSIDSLRLARRLSRLAVERGRRLDALLEINVSGEASKYGFAGYKWYRDEAVMAGLRDALGELAGLPNLRLRGLMTMAPLHADEKTARDIFASLYALREALRTQCQAELPTLSMGMTDDYAWAIAEGSNMVRVGRAIFGDRP